MKIPLRSMIRAPKGHYLLSFDLSQAEAWVVAYLCNDPIMKLELSTGDIHTRTARTVLDIYNRPLADEERYVGKKCNHAFNYKMLAPRCVEVINKEGIVTITLKQAKIYRERYLQLYNIEPWWLDVENTLREKHELTTPYGFRRRFYDTSEEGIKQGIAHIPQSTIADHFYGRVQRGGIPGGLKEVHARITQPHPELRLIHTAHDSGMIEAPNSIDPKELYGEVRQYIRRPMEVNGEEFTIPCDAKWGERWEEMEKIKEAA